MRSIFFTKLVYLLLAALFICNVKAQSPVDSTRIIRVLSYNIFHGETLKGDFDLQLIARVISSARPDIVALQEVDYFTNRVGNIDLATELGLRTGLTPIFGRAMYYDGGEYGEGILSRLSFLSTRNHALSAQPGKEPRAALEVNVILKSGDTIRFVGTHLDHTGEEDRLIQAKQINQLLIRDHRPTILAGDLNAKPGSETMKTLFKEWTRSFTENNSTFPSVNPKVKIDYILYRPAKRWRVLESKVIEEQVASDHLPILSILELLPVE